jgi:hypothetical protein
MTDEQPLALNLADAISRIDTLTEYQRKLIFQAAAELRRQHAENAELRAANEAFDKRQKWWNEKMFVLENVAPESLYKLTELRRLNAESDEMGQLSEIKQAPVAWAMKRKDGRILDIIEPDDHKKNEGAYTVPLYSAPQPQRKPLFGDLIAQHPGLIEELRGFEADHSPDGWPAIRMRQISALCDEVDRLKSVEAAARNLVKVKGRYHTEQAFKALLELLGNVRAEPPQGSAQEQR